MRTNQITTANTVNIAAAATTIATGMVNGLVVRASRLKSKCHSLHAWFKGYQWQQMLAMYCLPALARVPVGLVPVGVSGPVVVSLRTRLERRPDADRVAEARRTGLRGISRI